jgi:transcriptional regulator with XRE-family HTH domain
LNSTEIQELGAIIGKIRKEKGWRLEDLADENISPATISNIERGVARA